jgi:hypothetical protein
VTVLQERKKPRTLLATFLLGWLVAALAIQVITRLDGGTFSWFQWAMGVPLMPAFPAIAAAASISEGPPALALALVVIALMPLAICVLSRRANRRGQLLLCIVTAAWWLGFVAVYWSVVASGARM